MTCMSSLGDLWNLLRPSYFTVRYYNIPTPQAITPGFEGSFRGGREAPSSVYAGIEGCAAVPLEAYAPRQSIRVPPMMCRTL